MTHRASLILPSMGHPDPTRALRSRVRMASRRICTLDGCIDGKTPVPKHSMHRILKHNHKQTHQASVLNTNIYSYCLIRRKTLQSMHCMARLF